MAATDGALRGAIEETLRPRVGAGHHATSLPVAKRRNDVVAVLASALLVWVATGCSSGGPEVQVADGDNSGEGSSAQQADGGGGSAEEPMSGSGHGSGGHGEQMGSAGGHGEGGGASSPDGAMSEEAYAAEGGAEYGSAAGAGSRRPKLSQRPEEFGQWSPDDFRTAAQEGDPRLAEAIAYLGQSSQGKPETVALLKSVLQILATKKEASAGNAGAGAQYGAPAGAESVAPRAGGHGEASEPRSTPADGHGSPGGPAGGGAAALRHPAGLLLPVLVGFQSQPAPEEPRSAGPGGHGEPSADPGGHGDGGGAPPPEAMPEDYADEYAGEGAYTGSRGAGRRGGFQKETAVRAVIEALAANGTLSAWQTLQDVLAGRIETGVADAQVVDWILEALIEHAGPAPHPARQLLRRTIESPQALRTGAAGADGSRLSAEELRRRAVQVHLRYAVSAWESVLGTMPSRDEQGKPSPRQRRAQEYAGGRAPEAEAVAAADGHGGPGRSPQRKREFRDEAAGEYGTPGEGPQGQRSQKQFPPLEVRTVALDPPKLNRVLGYLWDDDFLDWVGGQTTRTQNPTREAELLALAGSLPDPAVRASVYRALQARWEDGADVLIERGVFQRAVRDPGMMAVLKSLPRHRGGFNVRPRSGRQTEELKAKMSWLRASGYLLRALNEQFYRASQHGSGSRSSRSSLPIDLHEGAYLDADYRLDWPDDLQKRGTSVSTGPLKVRYVRVEQNEFTTEQLYAYKRQFGRTEERELPNNQGFWFDTYGRGSEPELMRSVDVLLMDRQAGGGGGRNYDAGGSGGENNPGAGRSGQQARYTVEVLVIEVPNPAAQSE